MGNTTTTQGANDEGAGAPAGGRDPGTERRGPSDTHLRMANGASILNSIATELAGSGGDFDRLPPDKKVLFLRDTLANCRATIRAFERLVDDLENDSIG